MSEERKDGGEKKKEQEAGMEEGRQKDRMDKSQLFEKTYFFRITEVTQLTITGRNFHSN